MQQRGIYFLVACVGFMLFVVLAVTSFSVGRFYTLPCSLSKKCKREMKDAQWETFNYHQQDLSSSKRFLEQYFRDNRTKIGSTTAKPLLCMGVISVTREHQYVLRVLKSLFKGTHRSDWDNVQFFVLNADRDWARNQDVESLSNVIEVKRSDSSWNRARYFAKQNLDYTKALQICSETSAEYAIILEDDGPTVSRFLTIVKQDILEEIKSKELRNWLWIKLYVNPVSEFFSNQALAFVAFFGICCGFVLYFAYVIFLLLSSNGETAERWNMPLIVLTIAVSIIISSIVIGYPNLPIDKQGIVPTSQNAYTVGMMYPAKVLPDIIEYVRGKAYSGGHIDMLLGEMAQRRGMQRFVYKPCLVSHVGAFSSRHNKK